MANQLTALCNSPKLSDFVVVASKACPFTRLNKANLEDHWSAWRSWLEK